MNRQQLYIFSAILVASLSLGACASVKIDPTAPPPTAAQTAAAKAQAKQVNFDLACKYGGGVWQTAKPILATPNIAAKIAALGPWAPPAVKALDAFVNSACGAPLDINNADAVIQRGYDAAGQVAVIVAQALTQ